VNGEAIYESKPWKFQNDTTNPNVWYTAKGNTVYAILLEIPTDGKIELGAPQVSDATQISLLGYAGKIQWLNQPSEGVVIDISSVDFGKLPSQWALAFKLININ